MACPAGFSPPAVYPAAHQSSYQIVSSLRGSFSFLGTLSDRGLSPSVHKKIHPKWDGSMACLEGFEHPTFWSVAGDTAYRLLLLHVDYACIRAFLSLCPAVCCWLLWGHLGCCVPKLSPFSRAYMSIRELRLLNLVCITKDKSTWYY